MKKIILCLCTLFLLSACEGNQTQRVINSFTPDVPNHFHFVVFYENAIPDAAYQSTLKGMKVFLARKNIQSNISYQKIATKKRDYNESLQVQDKQVIVFDYKGIRFNARNVKVLEGMILQVTR
ncbi:hypothetical protein LCL89_14650 [Halobacillus yeomjeoni]|uniref:hypothetical protein n=1 Tax=Halobacillus yeomjeoni TaxID=311194 RepID=UPI001CD72B21|nr:hypothetical protein [Halobacillus yeomjeoni]MCA0985270.1 hypothetical protein [Halobacillus yeomjeoni]